MSKGQSCLGCLTEDFLGGNTGPKFPSRLKSPGAGIMAKGLELPLSSKCLTGLPLTCLWFLKDMPLTTNGSRKTGDRVPVLEGCAKQLPTPRAPEETTVPLLTFWASFIQTAFSCLCWGVFEERSPAKQLCGSCFLCLFFSPSSLFPPSIPLSPLLSSLSKPFTLQLNKPLDKDFIQKPPL